MSVADVSVTGQVRRDPFDVVADATRRLATGGSAVAAAVLDDLAGALSVPARVSARHGSHYVGERGRAAAGGDGLRVPLRAGGRRVGVLRVLPEGELSSTDVRLIETCAALIAATLGDDTGTRYDDMVRGVLDGEAERAEIAAALHEGPVAALVAARYALDSGAEAAAVRAVLSQALGELRAVVTGQRVRGMDGDLPGALRRLARELRARGVRVEVGVLDLAPGSVPAVSAVAAYRVVAASLNGVTGPATVVVDGGTPGHLRITVTGADDMLDAGALDRWARRIAALDGELERHPDGVTLHLPCHLPVASTSGAAR